MARRARSMHGNSSLQHMLHEAQQDAKSGRAVRQQQSEELVPAARRGVPVALRARVAAAQAAQALSAAAAAAPPTPSLHTLSRSVSTVEWMRGRTYIADVCVCSVVRLRDGAGRVALVTPPESRRRHLPADSDPERAQRRGEHPAAPLRQSTEVNRQQQRSGSQGGASLDSQSLEPKASPAPAADAGAWVPIGGVPTDRARRRKLCELALRLATQRGVAGAVDADDLGTDCVACLRVRLPVRVRLKEWGDLTELDPWLELLRRQPGAAAAALASCRADLRRAGVPESLASDPLAMRVEGSGFACSIVPHPTLRSGFRVWIAHITDCTASAELEGVLAELAQQSSAGAEAVVRFVSHSEILSGSVNSAHGGESVAAIGSSAALLLQRPMRLRSSVLSQILYSYAHSPTAARLAAAAAASSADTELQQRSGSSLPKQRQEEWSGEIDRTIAGSGLAPGHAPEPEPEHEPEIEPVAVWSGEEGRTLSGAGFEDRASAEAVTAAGGGGEGVEGGEHIMGGGHDDWVLPPLSVEEVAEQAEAEEEEEEEE